MVAAAAVAVAEGSTSVPAGRALGVGLLVGGLGVLVLMLVWLVVSGAQSGGIVLGLLLALVFAGPLIGAGAYVLSRQQAERQEAAAFASKRRVLESDRLFRDEIAAALRGLASRPELRDLRLGEMADDVAAAFRRGAAWEDAVHLDDSSIDTLGRYDDLVRERVRRLRDGAQDPATVAGELRQAVDQREDLLRGRRPPSMEPSVLMRASEPRRGAAALEQLKLGDAIAHEGVDYVVDALADYFREGERWKLAKLAATSGENAGQWLYVGTAGLELALLSETSPNTDRSGDGTAVVTVESRAGKAEGVLVSYRRARQDSTVTIQEDWPDGTRRAYSGSLIDADDLEVWPTFTTE